MEISNNKNYQFLEEIDEICRGDWGKRFSSFKKYFGELPQSTQDKKDELNKLRITRNDIGHYMGRTKTDYSAPLLFSPLCAIQVSHNSLLNYFKLINDVAKEIDFYLKISFIGSYDIIKCYFDQVSKGYFSINKPGAKAREFQRLLGGEGLPPVGNEYYRNLINYCDLDNPDDLCRYSMKACIQEINRQLKMKGTPLIYEGRSKHFNVSHFKLFIRIHAWKTNDQYCQKNPNNLEQGEYRYSRKVIDEIIEEVSTQPDSIISMLKNKLSTD